VRRTLPGLPDLVIPPDLPRSALEPPLHAASAGVVLSIRAYTLDGAEGIVARVSIVLPRDATAIDRFSQVHLICQQQGKEVRQPIAGKESSVTHLPFYDLR